MFDDLVSGALDGAKSEMREQVKNGASKVINQVKGKTGETPSKIGNAMSSHLDEKLGVMPSQNAKVMLARELGIVAYNNKVRTPFQEMYSFESDLEKSNYLQGYNSAREQAEELAIRKKMLYGGILAVVFGGIYLIGRSRRSRERYRD